MPLYTVSSKAYFKIFFHAAKHPHKAVNGVLVGTADPSSSSTVAITDAIPLLHHWTSLSPMMEIGLDLARTYTESEGLKLVGYYQATERLDDTALYPVGVKVVEKVRQNFKDAIAFVVDGDKIGTDDPALVPYTPVATPGQWRPAASNPPIFTLQSPDLPQRAVAFVRDQHLHQKFGDFDDHLEDVAIDWLRNPACLPESVRLD